MLTVALVEGGCAPVLQRPRPVSQATSPSRESRESSEERVGTGEMEDRLGDGLASRPAASPPLFLLSPRESSLFSSSVPGMHGPNWAVHVRAGSEQRRPRPRLT